MEADTPEKEMRGLGGGARQREREGDGGGWKTMGRWVDSRTGGGGRWDRHRGEEMDGNPRERMQDTGHDGRGGPGEETKQRH